MPTKKPQLKTYVNENTYEKFKIIAEKEHRSTSNYLEMLVSKEIENYENKNGTINIKNIVQINDNTGTINM